MTVLRSASRSRQRGLSFFGVVFIGVFAVVAFAVGGQSIPILLESQNINKAATKAAKEGATVDDVRKIFDKAAAIDDIASIRGSDLVVTKRNDKIVVTYKYAREIPLAGPAYLVYRFEGQTQ